MSVIVMLFEKKHEQHETNYETLREQLEYKSKFGFLDELKSSVRTDEEYAKSTTFGKLIAPGVMSFMSVWAKYLEINLAGKEVIAGKSTKVEWIKPVYAGDVLKSTCTVSNLMKRNAHNGLVELTFEVVNQKGDLVLTNVTEMVVKCKPV